MGQGFKPPDLDDNGNPLSSNDTPPDLDDYGNPVTPTKSFGRQVWDAVNEPLTDLPSRIGRGVSGLIDKIPVPEMTGQGGFGDFIAKDLAQARGFLSGSTEAAGDVATSLSSPLNIGVTAATGGSNLALRAGLPQIARGMQLGARAASIPGAIHGGMEVTRPDATMAERGIGLTEMAGNIAGGMHVPNVKGPILSRVWPEKAGAIDLPVAPPPPNGAIPDVIPPPTQMGANVNRVVVKKGATTMDVITKLTDEGFIASEVDPKTGGIVMIRPPKTPTTSDVIPQRVEDSSTPEGQVDLNPPIPLRGNEPMGQGFAEPPIGIPKTSPDISPIEAPFNPLDPFGVNDQMPVDDGRGALQFNEGMPNELPIVPLDTPIQPTDLSHKFRNEFSQDMAFTPDEMIPTEFPPIENSPFENQFDPRISGLPPRPDDFSSQVLGDDMPTELIPSSGMPHWGPAETTGRFPGDESMDIGAMPDQPIDLNEPLNPTPRTIQPEEWGDWGGLEKDIPTLVPDETGSHVAATPETMGFRGERGESGLSNDTPPDAPWMSDPNSINEPPRTSNMRVPGETGNVAVGGADPRVLDILATSLYTRDVPATVAKELLQNSVDEMKIAGTVGKPVRILFRGATAHPTMGNEATSITVADEGRGMTRQQLETIFTDVGKTGKGNEADASGGFGFAKVAPLIGGDYVHVQSTVNEGGQILRHSFEGTPDDLKNQVTGVPIDTEIMPPGTKTGFQIETFFPENKDLSQAKDLIKETVQSSPAVQNIEVFDDWSTANTNSEKFLRGERLDSYTEKKRAVYSGKAIPPKVADVDTKGSDVGIHYELDNTERQNTKVVYLNKGLFVFSENVRVSQQPAPHIPEKIVVDISSKVEEGKPNYPFPANREGINVDLKYEIKEWITNNISKKAEELRIGELQKIFDDLTPQSGNKFVTLDSGGRFTPDELHAFNTSPIMRGIANNMEMMLSDLAGLMKDKTPGQTAKFGFLVADAKQGGINIPSPKTRGEFAILINPMSAVQMAATPKDAAQRMVHVMIHEYTHNMARNEGAGFTWALSEVYGRFDLDQQVRYRNAILKKIASPDGNYAPEFQNLLQQYTESRGRAESTPDLLSRERESEWLTGDGEGRISGSHSRDGGGTPGSPKSVEGGNSVWIRQPTPDTVKLALQAGYKYAGETRADGAWKFTKGNIPPKKPPILESEVGGHRPRGTADTKASHAVEAYNLGRSLQAAWDVSAPFRQGIGLIHKKEFWTSLPTMFKAYGSEAGFKGAMDAIKERPLFKTRTNAQGKQFPSFADDAGLKLTSLDEGINLREEMIISKLAEKVPLVRRSNRAYTAFLNSIRAGVFESLVTDAKVFGADAKINTVLARELAGFVNNASGRGDLKALDKHAVLLGQLLFSPRLIASRLQMLNPQNYVMGHPAVRKEYLKSLFAIAAVGNTIGQLGKMAGGTVSNDPNSADFGKIKIGDTRLDPFGGFQQYIVAANRLLRPNSVAVGEGTETGIVPLDTATGFAATGGQRLTSSNNPNSSYDLWNPERPFDPVHMDVIERFGRGKAHPVIGFAWSLLKGRKEMSGQPMNFSTMNPVENAIAKQFIPLIVQDIEELAKHDPQLIPILGPLAALGMGVQSYSPD